MEFTCSFMYTTAYNVTWLRNGQSVSGKRGYVESVQVQNRLDNTYTRTLRVSDLAGFMGNNTFTCMIQNNFGQDQEHITFDNRGM